jgi:hypothetical protein
LSPKKKKSQKKKEFVTNYYFKRIFEVTQNPPYKNLTPKANTQEWNGELVNFTRTMFRCYLSSTKYFNNSSLEKVKERMNDQESLMKYFNNSSLERKCEKELDSSLDFLSWSFIFKLTFIKQISFIHPCG